MEDEYEPFVKILSCYFCGEDIFDEDEDSVLRVAYSGEDRITCDVCYSGYLAYNCGDADCFACKD